MREHAPPPPPHMRQHVSHHVQHPPGCWLDLPCLASPYCGCSTLIIFQRRDTATTGAGVVLPERSSTHVERIQSGRCLCEKSWNNYLEIHEADMILPFDLESSLTLKDKSPNYATLKIRGVKETLHPWTLPNAGLVALERPSGPCIGLTESSSLEDPIPQNASLRSGNHHTLGTCVISIILPAATSLPTY